MKLQILTSVSITAYTNRFYSNISSGWQFRSEGYRIIKLYIPCSKKNCIITDSFSLRTFTSKQYTETMPCSFPHGLLWTNSVAKHTALTEKLLNNFSVFKHLITELILQNQTDSIECKVISTKYWVYVSIFPLIIHHSNYILSTPHKAKLMLLTFLARTNLPKKPSVKVQGTKQTDSLYHGDHPSTATFQEIIGILCSI